MPPPYPISPHSKIPTRISHFCQDHVSISPHFWGTSQHRHNSPPPYPISPRSRIPTRTSHFCQGHVSILPHIWATSQYQSIWALYYPDSIQERMPSQNHSYPAPTLDPHAPGRCTDSPHSGPAMTRIAMFGEIMSRISHFLRSSVTGSQKVPYAHLGQPRSHRLEFGAHLPYTPHPAGGEAGRDAGGGGRG